MTEQTESMEDRLRAHFSDSAPPIGDRDTAEAIVALEQVRSSAAGRRRRRDVRRAALALTAAAAAIAGVALVAGRDESGQVDTTPAASTSTAVPTTAPGSATTTEGPTSTTEAGTATPEGVDRAVVAFESGVLGGWEDGVWRLALPGDATNLVGTEFALVRLDEPIIRATADSAEACEIVEGNVRIGLPWPGTTDVLSPPAVAVSGVADPRPRPVTILDPASPAYGAVAAEVVAGVAGVNDDDATIVQLVRTDVEGDGTDEVFGVVERLSDPESLFAQPGDYSIAFLRRVLPDDTVETLVLRASIATEEEGAFVQVYRASAFLDANGDGRTELALFGRYYEGAGMELFDVGAGHTPEQVLGSGCGA